MFLWTCFVSETVVILYDMRSRRTICIMKCGCTVREKYVYNCYKFVLYVDIPKFFFVFLFCLFFFRS